ncbi:MAG: dihydrodipicolinate synthase family protein [Anaerolineae bacterium]|nr:dihydrodipicolinate synthase family protein [Anaerolineae bacterium]
MKRTLEETKSLMRGVINIQFTPFKSMTEIDEEALRANTRFMIENGIVNGRGVLVIGGSNGEGFSLSTSEYQQLIDIVVEEANGRVPVCVGCVRPATQPVIEIAKYAEQAGADCIMVLPPHYYKNAPPDVVFDHYKAIADATEIPIMIYNNCWVTGQDLSVDLLRRLAEIDQIVALKECTPYFHKLREVAFYLADRFAILPCFTQKTMPFDYQLGAVGYITLLANFTPQLALEIHDVCLAHDFEKAQELYARLRPVEGYIEAAVASGGPARETAIVKEMCRIAGRPMGQVERLPVVRPDEDERREIRRLMTEAGLL